MTSLHSPKDSKIEGYGVRELTQFVYCLCTVLVTSLGEPQHYNKIELRLK